MAKRSAQKFDAATIVKNSDEEKFVYSGYGISFDGKGSWSLGNDYAKNVVNFGVDNSLSSYTSSYNQGNDISVLGEGNTFGINGKFGAPEKNFTINFSKAKTKFCLSFHYNGDNSYLFVNGKEIYRFKASNGNVNIPSRFYLGSISNNFSVNESKEVSLKGNVYEFSVDCNAIAVDDVLDIQKYLMKKNSIV